MHKPQKNIRPPSPSGSTKKLFFVAACDQNSKLADFLAKRLSAPGEEITRLIQAGAAYIQGQRTKNPNQALCLGQRIHIYLPTPTTASPSPTATPTIAYVDDEIAIIDKPTGLPSITPRQGSFETVENFARQRWGKDARLLHRLDQEASGLLLISLDSQHHGYYQQLFDKNLLRRRYFALVAGHLPAEHMEIDSPLAMHQGKAHISTDARARPAHTEFRLISSLPNARGFLLEVEITTGRTHQIRAHLASIKCPLLGDERYGGPAALRLGLHAHCLIFHHRRGQVREIHSPLPQELRTLASEQAF